VKAKPGSFFGIVIVLVVLIGLSMVLVPAFAAGVGRLVGGLWVTVMGAIAGLLGGMLGA
jgi:hypothetical protein